MSEQMQAAVLHGAGDLRLESRAARVASRSSFACGALVFAVRTCIISRMVIALHSCPRRPFIANEYLFVCPNAFLR